MTTHYYQVHNVAPQFFIFRKDGKIVANTQYREEIGTWKHTHPREENRAYYGRSASRFVKDMWTAGLYYKGEVSQYTRKELKEALCQLIKQKGLSLIESEK